MGDDTPFEPHRFASAVDYYLAGRPVYPPALIRRVAEDTGVTSASRVIDIGCGPGPLSIGFAYFVHDVLALDPEPAMLEAARRAAQGLVPNIRFLLASSYDLAPNLGAFRLATMGRSFHWMDRADTLRRLDTMLEPSGAVVLFDDDHIAVPENHWRKPWRQILHRHAGADTTRQRIDSPDWIKHEAILLASPFSALTKLAVIVRQTVTVETLLNRASSMSSTAPARLGDRTQSMRRELAAMLNDAAPKGEVEEVLEWSALIARRPPNR